MRFGKWNLGAAATLSLALFGCAVGPKYQKADVPTPPSWSAEAPWRMAEPKDGIPKGAWWALYQDPALNQFEQDALKANQSIQLAATRVEQARDLARVQVAGFFPSLSAGVSAQRQRLSANRPAIGATAPSSAITENVFQIPFQLNYEADLFGRVRRNVEAANAQYQSTAADLENVRLLITSDLASDYFTVRELDAEISDIEQAISYDEKGLRLVENRHAGGVASGLDVAQQETVLDAARAQLHLLRQQRANFEHAMATLVGAPAPTFHVAPAPLNGQIPAIPMGVPSDVLERRPDIAEAERQMASENALIGVAKSAFYPSILLAGGGGLQSADIAKLFGASSTLWSLGISAAEPIFSGGRLHAQLDFAKAGYQGSVATYRNTVLTAFQQVEDGLSGLTTLADAASAQQRAVEDSQRFLNIANDRYVGGLVTYLDVITAEQTLLTNQRLATQLLGQRLVTSVFLVKALGGGWDRKDIDALQVRASSKNVVQQ
ncbi:MAG TPA: efflux transporter outer membrane subunit [Terriglobales bacterium]|nr:efflux transporter outer membrane subunit [Terriglobales bacterium]